MALELVSGSKANRLHGVPDICVGHRPSYSPTPRHRVWRPSLYEDGLANNEELQITQPVSATVLIN